MVEKRARVTKTHPKVGAAFAAGERPFVAPHPSKELPPEVENSLTEIVASAGQKCGLEKLPPLEP